MSLTKEQALKELERHGFTEFSKNDYDLFRNDLDVVTKVVQLNGEALSLLSDHWKDDRATVAIAIIQQPNALYSASERLKDDTDIVHLAISKNWRSLEFASVRLRNDKETVLLAVTKDARALHCASDEIYELCAGQADSAKYLQTIIMADSLQSSLTIKPGEQKPTKKFKV